MAVSPDGSAVYASDAATNRITVLTRRGRRPGRDRRLAGPALARPQLAVDGAGKVWVADRGNDRVVAYRADGALVTAFGERGIGAGQFVEPAGITVDCHGLVTVAEADNNRVQQFQFGALSAVRRAARRSPRRRTRSLPPSPDPVAAAADASRRRARPASSASASSR